jgi:hypothetical protein
MIHPYIQNLFGEHSRQDRFRRCRPLALYAKKDFGAWNFTKPFPLMKQGS